MDIRTAYGIINLQNSSIRAIHGTRFNYKGYEYEIRYEGGFACFAGLYRREIGKRNFKYFKGVGCSDCFGAIAAVRKIINLLPA